MKKKVYIQRNLLINRNFILCLLLIARVQFNSTTIAAAVKANYWFSWIFSRQLKYFSTRQHTSYRTICCCVTTTTCHCFLFFLVKLFPPKKEKLRKLKTPHKQVGVQHMPMFRGLLGPSPLFVPHLTVTNSASLLFQKFRSPLGRRQISPLQRILAGSQPDLVHMSILAAKGFG